RGMVRDAMIRVDHVIRAVRDLDGAGARMLADHGLASVPGGRHVGMGTANRIVPLGDVYLELIGVVDVDEAAGSPLGAWVSSATAAGDRWGGWVAATDDLESVAARHGLEVLDGSRERPDGLTVRWRMAGMQRA